MAAFDSIFKCSIGSTSFQLRDYSLHEEAIVEAKLGRTGTKITLEGEGWVEADDPAGFSAALAAAAGGFRVDGVDVIITGMGGVVEAAVLAAGAINGGPHVSFKVLKCSTDGAALVKAFEFSVTCETPKKSGAKTSSKKKVTVRPDGLTIVNFSGEIKGNGAGDYFRDTQLPQLSNLYPATDWILTYNYTGNVAEDDVSFDVTFTELAASYPNIGGATLIVDGDETIRTERDEQYRFVTTSSFDFLFTGNPATLRDKLRPQAGGPILRESCEFTIFREQRLRCSFTQLAGANGDNLMDWSNVIELDKEDAPITPFEYANAAALLAQQAPPAYRATQRGRAVGAGAFPREPEPAFDIANLSKPRRLGFTPLNDIEMQTTWQYEFAFKSAPAINAGVLTGLRRPATPAFY